jgi:hypothetical protein
LAVRLEFSFNFDPISPLKVSDANTLLAIHNFCLDNLKAHLLKVIADKKSQDQLKENNDLMDYMNLVYEVMLDFQNRIVQNFFLNEKQESNALLEKQFEESIERIEELNRLYAQVQAIELATQKLREQEYQFKAAVLASERKELLEKLFRYEQRVVDLRGRLADTNKQIVQQVGVVIDNIARTNPPVDFEAAGVKLKLSQDEIARAVKREVQEDLNNGTFELEKSRPNIKTAFVKLGIEKLVENDIQQTPQALSDVNRMADRETDNYIQAFKSDENAAKVNELTQQQSEIKTELIQAELNADITKDELLTNAEEIIELAAEYGVNVEKAIKQAEQQEIKSEVNSEEVEGLKTISLQEEDEDPFASFAGDDAYEPNVAINNEDKPDDEIPPPPGEPDNNNYPSEPPPSFAESQRAHSVSQQVNAIQEQNASNENIDYPAPSAPPEEVSPIPNVAPPIYAGNVQEAKEPAEKPVSLEKKAEERKFDPVPIQENKADAKNVEVKPLRPEIKEIKGSTLGIIGKLGGTAAGVKRSLDNKSGGPTVQQVKTASQSVNQENKDVQEQQNQKSEPEIKGPGRRR